MGEMDGKVSKQAVLIMMGMDNGMFYEENEDGGVLCLREERMEVSTWRVD